MVGLAVALFTYDHGNWNVIGQYGFLYFLMWAAIRWTKLQHWEKFGDFSYGVYIFAWPLMKFCCYFGLQKAGMLAYFAVIVVGHPRDRVLQLAPDREARHVAQGLVARPAAAPGGAAEIDATAEPEPQQPEQPPTRCRPWPAPPTDA